MNIFKKFWVTITMLFGGERKLEKFINTHVDDVVTAMQLLKGFINSGLLQSAAELFPRYKKKAEAIIKKVEDYLIIAIEKTTVGAECMQLADTTAKLNCFIEMLKNKTHDEQNEIFEKVAVAYTVERSREFTKKNQPVPEAVAKSYVNQHYYEKYKIA